MTAEAGHCSRDQAQPCQAEEIDEDLMLFKAGSRLQRRPGRIDGARKGPEPGPSSVGMVYIIDCKPAG
jgi:hypothetical protein